MFRQAAFHTLPPERQQSIAATWEETLQATAVLALPEDLAFLRRMLEVGTKVVANRATVADFLELANRYAALWQAERKPDGLDQRLCAFWAAAGRQDAQLYVDSRGWLSTLSI